MVKPTIVFILLVSIAGYIYQKRCHFTYIRFNKSNGYHTFLTSAATGGGLFLLAAIILGYFFPYNDEVLNSNILTSSLTIFFKTIAPSITPPVWFVNFTQISIFAIILSFCIPFILSGLAMLITWSDLDTVNRGAFRKLSDTDDTPEFTSIYFESCEYGLPIAFTLTNRKVYIGYIIFGAKHQNDIMVLPLKSGYRCTEELRLEIVTDYIPVVNYIINNEGTVDVDRFLVAIPVREIAFASLHDFGYKDLFNKHEVPKKEKGLLKRVGLI